LVGLVVLLGSLLSYGMATALIVRLVVRLIRSGYTGLGFWKSVAVMMIVTLITAVAHLTQIALWAVAFLMSGEVSTFEKAFYFSAENYTALGYGDIGLSEQWRLLGPLEAVNGLLLFGLSTAVMFAVMSHLIMNRLRSLLGAITTLRFPIHPPPVDPARDDNKDVEELRLLLQTSEVRELAEAARQEGLTAAGLAHYLIRDFLLWMRSDLGKALGRKQRRLAHGEER
jgi:hypothetical protein